MPGNPKGIASFADLASPDLKVVVCAPRCPAGRPPQKIEHDRWEARAGQRGSRRQVTLGKVTSGDADAGLVYVTDVAAAGPQVQGVDFPEAEKATTNYPIAITPTLRSRSWPRSS